MKKILVLLLAAYLSSVTVQAKTPEDNFNRPVPPPSMTEEQRTQHEKAFEQRLGLTEEQKQKSKEIRLEGREKIKPVIDKIKAREQQVKLVKESGLTSEEQEKKLNTLESEIRTLRKQAHDIRVENMKSFEDLLTAEQKKILKEMKQEGRQEFNKRHMPPPPMNNER